MTVDPEDAIEATTEFLASYRERAGASGYVVPVSGGLDSAVVLALCVRAVGADDVVGLSLPGEPSREENVADARRLCEDRGVAFEEVPIAPVVEAVTDAYPDDLATLTVGNVRARVRMVLWYVAANERAALVAGGGNRSEHLLGYFTKYGDGGVDVEPLGELYKTEVRAMARELGLERFAEKTPTAELWAGQTDESELGAPYDVIDPVLRRLVDRGRSVEAVAAAVDCDRGLVERFAEMYERSAHKRSRPPSADVGRAGDP